MGVDFTVVTFSFLTIAVFRLIIQIGMRTPHTHSYCGIVVCGIIPIYTIILQYYNYLIGSEGVVVL